MEDRHINFLRTPLPVVHENTPKKPRKKKWLFLFIIVLCIVGISGYVHAQRNKLDSPLDYDPVTLEPKKPEGLLKKLSYLVFKRDTTLQGEQHDRINVLLLGMGGLGHDGPFLTDTIMIASIQPSTNQIALISIPRDLGVEIPNHGVYKVNHANHFGEMEKSDWGGAYATEVITQTFNIKIPYYIRVDFTAFAEIVDEVGGVRVEIDRPFTDYMYPTANDLYQTVSFAQGSQTMDGNTALKFARSRHGNNGEGSDFARAARQQKLMLALKEKMLSFSTLTNPVRIKHVIDTLERHMTTNMDFEEIMTLVRMGKQLDTHEIRHIVLDNGPQGFLMNATGDNGAYLLLPKSGNFSDINEAIDNVFEADYVAPVYNYENSPTHETTIAKDTGPDYDGVSIEIQNATWRPGLAARVKQMLFDEHFFVENIANAPIDIKPLGQSTLYLLRDDIDSLIISDLQKNLSNINISTDTPDYLQNTANTDIIIVLGDDFVE